MQRIRSSLFDTGPKAIVITGTPGVGKSRLLQEIWGTGDAAWHTEFVGGSRGLSQVPFGVMARLLRATEGIGDSTSLMAALHREVMARAGDRRVVLLVDDGHEIDEQSAGLIVQLTTHGAKAVIAARPGALPKGLGVIRDQTTTDSLRLDPLTKEETSDLAASLLGSVLDAELSARLWELTLGNPLYLVVLVREAFESGAIKSINGRWVLHRDPAPARLQDLLARRFEDLGSGERHVLEVLAVGRPMSASHLSSLARGRSIDQLVEEQLVTRHPSGGDEVLDMAHPLLADAVDATLSPSRRRKLRDEITGVVRSDPSLDGSMLIRAASWQLELGDELDTELVLAAALEAFQRTDFVLATELAHQVHQRLGDIESGLTLARSLTYMGRPGDALRILDELSPDSEEQYASLALTRAHTTSFGLGQPDRGAEILRVAGERLPGSIRWRLDAERAIYAAFAGNFGETFKAATDAIVNPNASAAGLLTAHVNLSLALAMTARLDEFQAIANRGRELSAGQEGSLPLAADQIGLAEASALTTAGLLAEAEKRCLVGMGNDSETNPMGHLWESWLGIVVGFQGRMNEAITYLASARRGFEIVDPFRLKPQSTGLWALHLLQTGQTDATLESEIGKARVEAAGETRLAVWIERAAAWLDYRIDRDAAYLRALENGTTAIERDHVAWGTWALHDVVRWGRPGVVADVMFDAVNSTSGASILEVMSDHARSLVGEDPLALMTVVDRFTEFGSHLLAAEAAAQAAELMTQRSDTLSAARADMIASLLTTRCTGARTPAMKRIRSDLTTRHREIATDAISGHTSRSISERRFISVRTVDNHLGRVYRHFGVSGRDELIHIFGRYTDDSQPTTE